MIDLVRDDGQVFEFSSFVELTNWVYENIPAGELYRYTIERHVDVF